MMTPKEFLEFQYGIDISKKIDEKGFIHPTFLSVVMRDYTDYVLLNKVTEMNQKDPDEAIREYRLKLLEDVKFGFDICSDTSAFCLGFRREKENKPIDKSISPIKRTLDDKIRSWDDGGCSMGSTLNTDDDE
jgi:hypothetical protein